jgi:hypothetical protein
MDDPKVNPDVASALSSAKSVLATINGLTLTNTLLVLITGGHYTKVTPLGKLGMENVLFAVVLMANIVRFYHGNVRHLDAAYGSESVARAASGRHAEPRGGLGVDFFIIFTQSLLFSITSFYILSHRAFIVLFIALLIFDAIWTVFSQQSDKDPIVSPQRMWVLNNLVAVTIVAVFYFIYIAHKGNWALDTAVFVLAATTVADFTLNWRFYFPKAAKGWHPGDPTKVFLSAPLTQYVDPNDPSAMDHFRTHWSRIASALERNGHEVFSAHKREAWGSNLDSPESALKADIAGLIKSKLVIAYIGHPPSPGVQLELGYAIATHKQMLIFVDFGQKEPYLVRGFSGLPNAEVIDIERLSEIKLSLARKGLVET